MGDTKTMQIAFFFIKSEIAHIFSLLTHDNETSPFQGIQHTICLQGPTSLLRFLKIFGSSWEYS